MTRITISYHKQIIEKHVIPYVLGVFLGCTLTIPLVCLSKLSSISQRIETSSSTQPAAIEQKQLLYIGTLTSGHTLHTRGKTCFATWGKNVPGRMALYCNCDGQDEGGLPVIQLPGMDV